MRYAVRVNLENSWTPRDVDRQVSLMGTVDEVLAQCEQMHAEYQSAERWRPWIITGTVVGTLGLVFTSVGLTLPWLMLPAGVVLAVGGVLAFRAVRANLDARKLEIVRTVLTTFQPELRPGRPVQASIDFRGYWRFEPSDAWSTVAMTLDNGVTVQLTARSNNKRRTKSKRQQIITKDKMVEQLVVRLGAPKGQTLDAGLQVPRIGGRVGSLMLHQVKVAARAATFVFQTDRIVRAFPEGSSSSTKLHRLIQGQDAVLALVTSYHLLGRAGQRSAATG